jgi:ubiquinone/menaquinone biosynthesis C-methylase UbiE
MMKKPPLTFRLLANFLRFFFKLLYHQFAWTYDWVSAAVSLGMWKKWVLAVLPYLEGPRILELGHGPGHLQAALMQQGKQAIGLDASQQMGRLAVKGLRVGCCYGYGIINGYAQFLPFPNNCINQVVATFPSEYIFDQRTFSEVHRTLLPGGAFIILPLAWITGRRFHERAAAWLFRFTGQVPGDLSPNWEDWVLEPIRLAGFIPHVEWLELKASTLLIIHAQKPAD